MHDKRIGELLLYLAVLFLYRHDRPLVHSYVMAQHFKEIPVLFQLMPVDDLFAHCNLIHQRFHSRSTILSSFFKLPHAVEPACDFMHDQTVFVLQHPERLHLEITCLHNTPAYHSISFFFIAYSSISGREERPILSMNLDLCASTVFTDMNSFSAISLLP